MALILLVDDDTDFTSAMRSMLQAEEHEIFTAETAAEARALMSRHDFEYMFVDLSLPDESGLELIEKDGPNAIIITGHPSVKSAIQAVRGPVIDYLVKPVDKDQLLACITDDDDIQKPKIRVASKTRKSAPPSNNAIIGESRVMRELLQTIQDFGLTDEAVLILGESGTGKDLVARQIHEMRNPNSPFVPINCGAIPKDLIASELFGHEKGSFTGAAGKRKGIFERAGKGTVFLDEVGELPPDHQVALLRVLENRTIVPIGGETEVPVHAKIIAATNRELEKRVRDGEFREDLYFRLMVLPINVPPLRARENDIEVLARHFLRGYASSHDAPEILGPEALEALNNYHWPGNVRELKHTMLRAAILNRGKDQIEKIPDTFDRPLNLGSDSRPFVPGMSIKEVEKNLIEKTLKHYDGNKTQTAEALGISLKTLYNRLTEYGDQPEV